MTSQQEIFKVLSFIHEISLREEIISKSNLRTLQKNETLVREGEYVKILPVLLKGAIRVFQTRADREILLYYVEPSQTCMMSLSACFFNHPSAIQAVITEPSEILAIPARYIADWQQKYNSWNHFVIKTFRKRYDELLNTFESVAFDHMDKRVLNYLHQQRDKLNTPKISISHQQLANELGTTRVVISRILKQYELDQILKLHRGSVELLE